MLFCISFFSCFSCFSCFSTLQMLAWKIIGIFPLYCFWIIISPSIYSWLSLIQTSSFVHQFCMRAIISICFKSLELDVKRKRTLLLILELLSSSCGYGKQLNRFKVRTISCSVQSIQKFKVSSQRFASNLLFKIYFLTFRRKL